jgi:nitrogen regulatory protein P-II 2
MAKENLMNQAQFKLITIIVEPVLSASVIKIIRSLGATGFTLTEVRGEGSGEKSSGELPDVKTKIEVIVDADSGNQIMTNIAQKYFENYSVIVYAVDAQVIRQEKF